MDGIRQIHTGSQDETFRLGLAIGQLLMPGDVILLVGELGCGKTRLAKGIVSAATGASPDEIVSPTFTLINCFQGDFPVFHADLYRLEGNAVEEIGIDDAIESGGALIVEWAERRQWAEPDPLTICLYFGQEDNDRLCVFQWQHGSSWEERLKGLLRDE